MKKILIITLILSSQFSIAQSQKFNLNEAVEIAQKKSPDYQSNLFQNQASYWRNKNYKASFLPQIGINAILPSYTNSVRRITDDTGQDIFVNQNQSVLETRLSIDQSVPFTGGQLSINSEIEKINVFGDNPSQRYSVVPFSVNYYQNSLFYNPFKWDKKIEPLIYEESKRDFIESMEDISLRTCRLYFSVLKAQIQLKIAQNNASNQDTLFQIAKGRFQMGKIAENDLLQMELRYTNSKNNITTNIISSKRASQNLARYLELSNEDFQLDIPENLSQFEVDTEKALSEAESNRKFVIEYRRRRLQSEKELARVKGDNRLQLGVRANFGLSQYGEEFDDIFQNFDQQQNVTVTIGIPIFDWGVSKSRRKMAEANLDLVKVNLNQEKQAFEQEIYLHTLNWNNQRDFLATSEKAQEIAIRRYEITKKRYILGKITITDLNLAQEEKDKSVFQYLNALESFWIDYYTLRRLTLYDFMLDKKIEAEDILYN